MIGAGFAVDGDVSAGLGDFVISFKRPIQTPLITCLNHRDVRLELHFHIDGFFEVHGVEKHGLARLLLKAKPVDIDVVNALSLLANTCFLGVDRVLENVEDRSLILLLRILKRAIARRDAFVENIHGEDIYGIHRFFKLGTRISLYFMDHSEISVHRIDIDSASDSNIISITAGLDSFQHTVSEIEPVADFSALAQLVEGTRDYVVQCYRAAAEAVLAYHQAGEILG